MSNERKRRDALASLLPGSAPAPAKDQRAGPGTYGQPSLPAPAHGAGQFLVHFFAAWVTRLGWAVHMGACSSFSPPAVSSSGAQRYRPSIPNYSPFPLPWPRSALLERLRDVTKGRQDPEFMASILLGLPQGRYH